MKTNIFYNIFAGASILLAFSACTNLDEDVYDNIPANSFGSTETEINALVGTAYKTLKTYFSGGNFLALDDMAGSCTVTPTRKGGTGMMAVSTVKFICTLTLHRHLASKAHGQMLRQR